MIFGCQSSIIHAIVDIHIDIQPRISMQGHSTMDVRGTWIPTNGLPYFFLDIIVFNYIHAHWYLFGYPLISMYLHAWICYGFSILGLLVKPPVRPHHGPSLPVIWYNFYGIFQQKSSLQCRSRLIYNMEKVTRYSRSVSICKCIVKLRNEFWNQKQSEKNNGVGKAKQGLRWKVDMRENGKRLGKTFKRLLDSEGYISLLW